MADDASYFEGSASKLQLLDSVGLPRGRGSDPRRPRRGQIASAFAVAAHFSVSSEPALVSMPTGSGKSAAMTLLPFILKATRVLVVTPGRLIREQLAAEFASLHVLRMTDAIPESMLPPMCYEVKSRRATADSWDEMRRFDVVVGTPSSVSSYFENVVEPPEELFDLVIFDEGHHAAAPSWGEILRQSPSALAVLFTATTFRRDLRAVPGKLVYNLSLTQALEEGILSPVRFVPVDVESGRDPDTALAELAYERMNSDQHVAADSRIIARTSSVAHAKELLDIYRRVNLPMGLVTARTSTGELRTTLAAVREGALCGLISVGVLGEGFDFPTMKIGVYHRKHSSLPATLQFLGRISRTIPSRLQGELLAVRDEVSDETRELYSGDVSWSALVPALADAATAEEAERRAYVRSFNPEPTEPLSLAALRPRKDVQVFALPDRSTLDFHASLDVLGDGVIIYRGVDDTGEMSVIITEHLERPEWLDSDTLDGFRYELVIVYAPRERGVVFVQSSGDKKARSVLAGLGCGHLEVVDPVWLDRLMAGLTLTSYHSVGMRSTRAAGGRLAAYRMMAGSSVGTAVLPSETRSYGTGHAIARIRDPMYNDGSSSASPPGGNTSLGVSYARAKVFSPDLARLLEFRKWCIRLIDIVSKVGDAIPTGPPDLALFSPRRLVAFPDAPYVCLIDPALVGSGYTVTDPTTGMVANFEEMVFEIDAASQTELGLTAFVPGGPVWHGSQHLSAEVVSDSDWIVSRSMMQPETLAEFITFNPLTIFYGSGESSIGPAVFRGRSDYPPLEAGTIRALGFENTDIQAEHKGARSGAKTVKDYMLSLDTLAGSTWIVDDDRAGEAADLVCITRPKAEMAEIALLHLKASSEPNVGARVVDLYELLGQACRSVVWCDLRRLAGRLLARLNTGSKVVRGDPVSLRRVLTEWAAAPVAVRWTISVAQPGVRATAGDGSGNICTMLNDFVEWCSQHDARSAVYFHE